MLKNRIINKKNIVILSAILFVVFSFAVYAVILDNDVEVEENSDLTYYLNVSYDGVDKNGTSSSDTNVVEITSGYIYVEDKIPEGLDFTGFVTSNDGSIGAIKRSDGSVCPGYVVDDTKEDKIDGTTCDNNGDCYYHGLHYTKSDNTVRFTVKDIKAGCELTVGIITKTPSLNGEARKDFYNIFSAVEDNLSVISNQVHVYMGDEKATLYNVEYKYTGDVPDNAPDLPSDVKYVSGNSVGVANNVNVTGYEFSGWISSDVNISNGSFTMPSKNVTLTGSFERKESYKVTYKIDGDYPDSYILPADEEYYENNNVELDILKEGDIVDGYKFLGWETSDVEIDNDCFQMTNKDVTIIGKFERISYKVTYQFQGSVIPDNGDLLLPSTKEYYPGDKVTLEQPTTVNGYKFLGWYQKDNFTMPENDVIIYGEWLLSNGVFEPSIKEEIINKQDVYKIGDIVKFKITVTNTADFDIKNVMISLNNKGVKFTSGEDYELSTEHMVIITNLEPNDTVILYAEYEVTKDSLSIETNEVEILGALADNNYQFNTDKEYKASVEFKTTQEEKIDEDTKIIEASEETNNPTTLDDIVKYVAIFVVAIIVLSIIIFVALKNKKNK